MANSRSFNPRDRQCEERQAIRIAHRHLKRACVVVAFSLRDFVTTVFVEAGLVGTAAANTGVAISARAVSEPISAFTLR